MKKVFAHLMCIAVLFAGIPVTSCTTTQDGEQSIESLEQMSELDYNRWKLYIQLGVKIGANRLLEEGVVDEATLDVMADVVENVATKPIQAGATSIIKEVLEDELEKLGLNNDEAVFVLLVAEQELLARGVLDGVLDPETGNTVLSPRAKEMLGIVAGSLRAAGNVSAEEAVQAMELNANFAECD
jgi:hypothetical protein